MHIAQGISQPDNGIRFNNSTAEHTVVGTRMVTVSVSKMWSVGSPLAARVLYSSGTVHSFFSLSSTEEKPRFIGGGVAMGKPPQCSG